MGNVLSNYRDKHSSKKDNIGINKLKILHKIHMGGVFMSYILIIYNKKITPYQLILTLFNTYVSLDSYLWHVDSSDKNPSIDKNHSLDQEHLWYRQYLLYMNRSVDGNHLYYENEQQYNKQRNNKQQNKNPNKLTSSRRTKAKRKAYKKFQLCTIQKALINHNNKLLDKKKIIHNIFEYV